MKDLGLSLVYELQRSKSSFAAYKNWDNCSGVQKSYLVDREN